MPRYHNTDDGPKPCRAQTPESCTAKRSDGLKVEHFDDEATAYKVWQKTTEEATNPLASMKRKPKTTKKAAKKAEPKKVEVKSATTETTTLAPGELPKHLATVNQQLEAAEYEDIQAYAAASPEQHKQVDELITARANKSLEDARRVERMNISATARKNLKKELDEYRNHTAMLVEAHLASPHYTPASKELEDDTRVGVAVLSTSYDHSDVQWHLSRYNTLGGSDVAYLAMKDFADPQDISSFDKWNIKKMEQSKLVPPSIEDAKSNIERSELSRKGALYRGTMWEDRIRDSYVHDHPEMTVYNTKKQYQHPDRPWQKVNFDGVISNRPDGKPNGILEIKTGGDPDIWKDGVPHKYRAQTLYYLETTGFEHAQVRVVLNDAEVRDYTLRAEDEVIPGCGMNMKQYLRESVEPWWKDVQERREPLPA